MPFFNLFSKKPNELPDLEEMLRKWASRLIKGARGKGAGAGGSNGAGGGGGGGGEGGEDPAIVLPPPGLLAVMAGAAVVLLYALLGFFTVDANERVVMFRLGNPIGVRGPGLKWHMPLIEDYRKVNVSEVRRVEIGYRNDTKNKNLRESLMLTSDLNIIDMQFVVQYALNNAEQFLFENRFANLQAGDVAQQVAETAMREIVGRSGIDFVLYEGREDIAEEARALMQDIMDRYKTGIEVRQVAIQNVQPPDQVQDAFEDAIKARQDRERKINEGQAYANDILPRAEGQAARVRAEAEGYKESNIIRAQGESERFLLLADEFARAPAVTRRRLYLETMEEVMAGANKVLIDDKAGGNNVFYLPLDRLGAGRGGAGGVFGDGSQAGGAGAQAGAPPKTLGEFKDYLSRRAQGAAQSLEGRR